MPQAAIAGLAKFFIATFGVTSASGAAFALFAAKVFVYAATTYLLNRAAQSLAPRQRSSGLGSGTEVNYFDTGAPVRICYGLVKTGGMETIPPMTTSKDNSNAFEDLHKVLTIAGHEVDSFNFTHFDTTTIVNAQIGPMSWTTSDGMVSSGPFHQHAFIRRYRGTSTDSSDRILTRISSSQFGNARARGIAKAAITLRFNADIYRSVPVVTFTFQGKRCYDPRLDATPGSDPTNASFIVWTQNPAVCLADYLMSGLGGSYESDDIDWDTVVTAANYCDGSVSLPAATQARYTCNGVLFATDDFADNVKALVDSMLGRIIFRDGKWRMYAGSWQTPTFTILKEDWISGLSIRFEQGRKKRFNQMRTWYVDSSREWQRVESLPRTNPTYQTADFETIDAETEQLLCTNEFEAQRKGEFLLRQSRNQITVVGRLPPRFQNIALWDTGTIVFDHLGWSSKTFRCVGVDMNPDGSMDCVFSEEQSSDWTDMDAGDYNTLSTEPLPLTNATTPTEPPSFSASSQINGTILFSWTRPIVQPAGTEFQIIRSTNASDASAGTVVWQGNGSPVALVMPTSAHWYWVRAVANSLVSPTQPNTFGIFAIPRVEAENFKMNQLTPDENFTLLDATSLWRFWGTTNFRDVTTINPGAWSGSYSPTGGQYGGYFTLTGSFPSAFTSGALTAINPNDPLGFRASIAPAVYVVDVRVRSNSGDDFDRPRISVRLNYLNSVGSRQYGVGANELNEFFGSNVTSPWLVNTWNSMRGYCIREAVPPGGSAPYEQLHFYRSGGVNAINMSVDRISAQPVAGAIQSKPITFENQLSTGTVTLNWNDIYVKHRFASSAGSGNILMIVHSTDWTRYSVGDKWTIVKATNNKEFQFHPNSGQIFTSDRFGAMNSYAAIGQNSYGVLSVEKIDTNIFFISGENYDVA